MIERNQALPDHFLELAPCPTFGEYARRYSYRLAEHYENDGVIYIPSMPLNF